MSTIVVDIFGFRSRINEYCETFWHHKSSQCMSRISGYMSSYTHEIVTQKFPSLTLSRAACIHLCAQALTPGLKAVKVMAMLIISKTGNFSLTCSLRWVSMPRNYGWYTYLRIYGPFERERERGRERERDVMYVYNVCVRARVYIEISLTYIEVWM